jgi:hypothetical protein
MAATFDHVGASPAASQPTQPVSFASPFQASQVPEMLTAKQAAARCGVALDTFRQHVRRYNIKRVKYNSRCIRFEPAVIDAHKAKFSTGGSSEAQKANLAA